MATQEIYIRNATETEARGPFSPQQVSDLAEAGQVNAETLIYDANTEQWVTLNSNVELMALVFPQKKKHTLKARDIQTLNNPDGAAKPISVDDMLAAAEGRTDDTKGKEDPEIAMARAARIGMFGAIIAMVAAAAGEILPASAALMSLEGEQLIAEPLVLLGVADLVLAVLLGLGLTNLYPLVRFRAMLGLGLVGLLLFTQGAQTAMLLLAAGSLGLYCCTVFTSLISALVAVVAAVGGMGMLSWYFLNS